MKTRIKQILLIVINLLFFLPSCSVIHMGGSNPQSVANSSDFASGTLNGNSGAKETSSPEKLPRIGNFRILYSTLGYHPGAAKHVLVRTIYDINQNDVSADHSKWSLKDSKGATKATGKIRFTGKTFGIQLWKADFSGFTAPGTYNMEIELKNGSDILIGTLKSLTFKIEKDLLYNNVLKHLTIENAEARVAGANFGYGYYDCNWSTMGEGYSHGIFLNALSQTYLLRNDRLTENEKSRLMKAADIAFDYLLLLQKPTGEIDHQYPRRPHYQGAKFGIMNTQEAVYGMSAYLHIFKGKSPKANDENYNKVLKAVKSIENRAPWGWQAGYDTYGENLIPVYYHLYKYSGDISLKEKAIKKLNFLLDNINLRSMWRSSLRAIPLFEGLKYCVEEFKDAPDYDKWIEKAYYIKDTYFKYIAENNAFCILPVSTLENAKSEWDDMSKTPKSTVAYNAATAYSMDACILGQITKDESMKQIAAGGINWVLGLNPGVPRWAITNPVSKTEMESASFIGNLNARCVIQQYNVWKPLNNTFMSISNGLNVDGKNWWYENRWNEAENFIKTDGVYAYASCIYEDYLESL